MFGSRRSCTYATAPVTLPGMSKRGSALPNTARLLGSRSLDRGCAVT